MDMASALRIGSYLGMFAVMLGFERWAPSAASTQVKSSRVIFHLAISVANSIALYFTIGWVVQITFSMVEGRHCGLSHLLGLAQSRGPETMKLNALLLTPFDP